MTCTEEEKVLFATHMLREDANAWWNSTRAYLENQYSLVDWEVFKAAFFDKYFPKSFRDQMEREFLNLRQGSVGPVDAYRQRYEELFFFAPVGMREEETKIRRFTMGLRGSIERAPFGSGQEDLQRGSAGCEGDRVRSEGQLLRSERGVKRSGWGELGWR
ncbi:hypothetical protein NE237_010485 [Protea cynaroides]|uniref:Retrotransposon gag domain-containing protein n=1 Tax=Protea cynaroides TaxID=273540 RepID=A0A9Q0R195_9MAGN|nr:hypothetical protein NE237_010485 [Protea cynaroides]